MSTFFKKSLGLKGFWQLLPLFLFTASMAGVVTLPAAAQDQYQGQYQDQYQDDDPPGVAARLAYVRGSVSFQPAGEEDWVEAVPNRPMTVDDKLWTDQNSNAEIGLGATSIYLNSNTGVSFLNLDDRTMQVQLSAGTIDVRVRQLDQDEVVEIDTANQAFNIFQPGRYRIEASENGDYTVVTVREGDGQSTGNGQTYTVHAGQRATFSGIDRLNAELDQIYPPDAFDSWSDGRDRRYESSRSSQYCSREMVGYEDLDDNGDWQAEAQYGHVWFPRVSAGWVPYRDGHWAWIDPWGWTWVDDAPWGYAPFHYGRWSNFGGRWGWIPGPVAVRPVYAPALVVFVGGAGFGVGGNVGWFPLGPREVYVPSYRVSERYVQRVNVSNTVVNQTTVTNVYNTTIINKTTTINNVTYVNRNVNGAVTAVPQRTFASAQPVARAVVKVDARQVAAAPVAARVAVAPAREAVLGAHANTAGQVKAPPKAVISRPVIARTQPAPAPPSFAAKQQALDRNPGQPVQRKEMAQLRPASAPAPTPVKVVKPTQPATPPAAKPGSQPGRPGNQPGNQPAGNRPNNQPGNQPAASQPNANQPGNRPGNQPVGNDRPGANQPGNQPNRPDVNRLETNRPENNQPNRPENNQPNRPQPNQPQPNQPNNARPNNARPDNARPNANDDRPEANQPNRPQPNNSRPNNPNSRPDNNRPDNNRPNSNRPENQPDRPGANQPDSNRPNSNRPQPNRPDNQPDNPRPQPNRPNNQPDDNRPQPNNRPDNRPQPNRPNDQPDRTNRNDDRNQPRSGQPGNRPEVNDNRTQPNRPEQNRPDASPARTDRPPQNRNDAQRQQQQQKPPAKTKQQKTQEEKQREQEEKKPQ